MHIKIETLDGQPQIDIHHVTRVNNIIDDENLLLDIDDGPDDKTERSLYINPANIIALIVESTRQVVSCTDRPRSRD